MPYQTKWVMDNHFLKIMEIPTVASHILPHIEPSENTLKNTSGIPGRARDDVTAKLFTQDCKKFVKLLKLAASDLGENIIDTEKVHSIKFANGTELNSLASNPDVFAGKGGDVVLDEFALRKDPRDVYAIATPTIDWEGCPEIISTHRGSANFFNVLIKEIVEKAIRNSSLITV